MVSLDVGKSIRGFMEIYVVNTGVKFDLFALLKDPPGLSIQEIASTINIDEKYVNMWCTTAFAFHILDKENDKYCLKGELRDLLGDKGSTTYMGDFVRILASYLGPDMDNQYEFLKKGKIFPFYEHDSTFIELVVNRGLQRGKVFLEKVVPITKEVDEGLKKGSKLLDVGCGGGSFIKTLSENYPESNFTGVDISKESIEIAENNANANSTFVHISSHEINFDEDFDIITMNLVLHEVNDAYRSETVKKIFASLKPRGKLVMLEFPYPEKDEDFFDKNYTMGIYDQFFEIIWGTEHINWTEQQNILFDAGFKNIKREFLGDNTYVLITAEK